MNTLSKFKEYGLTDPFFRDFFDADAIINRAFGNSLPAANIAENDQSYSIELAVPGFTKNDFKVKVQDNILTVSAETKMEKMEEQKTYKRREYDFSSFSRSFTLPENVKDDSIVAKYDNGMLKLDLPKTTNPVVAAKEITVM